MFRLANARRQYLGQESNAGLRVTATRSFYGDEKNLCCNNFLSHQRSVVLQDVMIVHIMSPAPVPIAKTARRRGRLELSVAAGSKVCVLNMVQYDSDSISYFFAVLTPCKWIVFTVTQ